MLKIKPKALLVCGVIATHETSMCTMMYLVRRTRIRKSEMYDLLHDMVVSGMLKENTGCYYLQTFECEIAP